jgi:hypothetical protein
VKIIARHCKVIAELLREDYCQALQSDCKVIIKHSEGKAIAERLKRHCKVI